MPSVIVCLAVNIHIRIMYGGALRADAVAELRAGLRPDILFHLAPIALVVPAFQSRDVLVTTDFFQVVLAGEIFLSNISPHKDIMQLDHETYARILDNLHDGLYFVDTNRTITYWNKGAERITGFSAAEVVGRSCADNILSHVDREGKSLCLESCPLAASIADGREREAEVYLHHKDGHRVPVFVRVSTLCDSAGKVLGGLELFTDMSTILVNSARVQELERLAMLDTLTRLANRNYLEREFHARFEKLKRYKETFGILFIDIDHFKKVNDVYGHGVGDKILQFVATTFTANSRPFDLYGRWGGEEFIGLIRHTGRENLALLGNRLRVLIEHSYIIHEKQKLSVKISLGATMATENDTIDSLLKRADILLYESKTKGRNRLTLG